MGDNNTRYLPNFPRTCPAAQILVCWSLLISASTPFRYNIRSFFYNAVKECLDETVYGTQFSLSSRSPKHHYILIRYFSYKKQAQESIRNHYLEPMMQDKKWKQVPNRRCLRFWRLKLCYLTAPSLKTSALLSALRSPLWSDLGSPLRSDLGSPLF